MLDHGKVGKFHWQTCVNFWPAHRLNVVRGYVQPGLEVGEDTSKSAKAAAVVDEQTGEVGHAPAGAGVDGDGGVRRGSNTQQHRHHLSGVCL